MIMRESELEKLIINEVLKELNKKDRIRVGISARHVHLSKEHFEVLYGKDSGLSVYRMLMGKEFASNELVTLAGPSLRAIEKVRILGPFRKSTQVEIAKTDAVRLGLDPPVRPSGDILGSSPVIIIGPKGVLHITQGCIIANRHIHMSPDDALYFKVADNDKVRVKALGVRPVLYEDVQIRVSDGFDLEMHLDTDDANASGIISGDTVEIVRC